MLTLEITSANKKFINVLKGEQVESSFWSIHMFWLNLLRRQNKGKKSLNNIFIMKGFINTGCLFRDTTTKDSEG